MSKIEQGFFGSKKESGRLGLAAALGTMIAGLWFVPNGKKDPVNHEETSEHDAKESGGDIGRSGQKKASQRRAEEVVDPMVEERSDEQKEKEDKDREIFNAVPTAMQKAFQEQAATAPNLNPAFERAVVARCEEKMAHITFTQSENDLQMTIPGRDRDSSYTATFRVVGADEVSPMYRMTLQPDLPNNQHFLVANTTLGMMLYESIIEDNSSPEEILEFSVKSIARHVYNDCALEVKEEMLSDVEEDD